MERFTSVKINHAFARQYGLFPALVIDLVCQRIRDAKENPRNSFYGFRHKTGQRGARFVWGRVRIGEFSKLLSLPEHRIEAILQRLEDAGLIEMYHDEWGILTHVRECKELGRCFPLLSPHNCAREQGSKRAYVKSIKRQTASAFTPTV